MRRERKPERGARLERQALAAACRARDWRPLELLEDAALAAHERNRPGLEQALRVLESGEANALVAAKDEPNITASMQSCTSRPGVSIHVRLLDAFAVELGSSDSTSGSERPRPLLPFPRQAAWLSHSRATSKPPVRAAVAVPVSAGAPRPERGS